MAHSALRPALPSIYRRLAPSSLHLLPSSLPRAAKSRPIPNTSLTNAETLPDRFISARLQIDEAERRKYLQRVDRTNELVEDLVVKCREYLQPNPVTRSKMAAMGLVSKTKGTGPARMPYPQPEGVLGEAMIGHGRALGDDSYFGRALVESGDAYRQMADVKYALEDAVKQNFVDPLQQMQNKDLKEVAHHRKKLQGRRLDYDCKKRNARPGQQDDLFLAEEKLEESKRLAEQAIFNVLENDVEQISQLCALVDAQLTFHRQTTTILESLADTLKDRLQDASARPRKEHIPKPVLSARSTPRSKSPVHDGALATPGSANNGRLTPSNAGDPWATNGAAAHPPTSPSRSQDPWGQPPPAYAPAAAPARTPTGPSGPHCKALYDFDAENEGELNFKEGSTIKLISKIDENWFEGTTADGKSGFFPISYVQVITPLP